MDNPRMRIGRSDLERTLDLVCLSDEEDLKGKVRQTILMLGDCFPSGKKRDALGITYRQMLYIVSLAGLNREETTQFCRLVKDAGGLDSNQANHLIGELLASKQRSGGT
jgi:hypothetical protein